jgi:class 3 adenylate cyclase
LEYANLNMSSTLLSYFPRLLVEWQQEAPDAEWRAIEGTLVFMDISGFTAMSERLARHGKVGAEEVTEILNDSFTNLRGAAYDNGDPLKLGRATRPRRSPQCQSRTPMGVC